MNIQSWFPLGLTGWISLLSKGLSRIFSNTTVQKNQFSYSGLFAVPHEFEDCLSYFFTKELWNIDWDCMGIYRSLEMFFLAYWSLAVAPSSDLKIQDKLYGYSCPFWDVCPIYLSILHIFIYYQLVPPPWTWHLLPVYILFSILHCGPEIISWQKDGAITVGFTSFVLLVSGITALY